MSNLKGLAKITRKAELQRKIDEKTDYINRLKIGFSNIVRNYGFENMNEFYLSYKESLNAYVDYKQKFENWMKSYERPKVSPNKIVAINDKFTRLQSEKSKNQRYTNKPSKDRGTR